MMRGFYFITDVGLTMNGILKDVEDAIAGGTGIVQYRRKEGDTRSLFEEALALRGLCSERGVTFIVNDRLDIALAVGADGIHAGPKDIPIVDLRREYDGMIGVTVSTVEDAVEAVGEGASYLGVSPIYSTTTKSDAGEAVGPEFISAVRERVDVPLMAIGGITLARMPEVMAAGADGVCAISATAGESVETKVRGFVEAMREGSR